MISPFEYILILLLLLPLLLLVSFNDAAALPACTITIQSSGEIVHVPPLSATPTTIQTCASSSSDGWLVKDDTQVATSSCDTLYIHNNASARVTLSGLTFVTSAFTASPLVFEGSVIPRLSYIDPLKRSAIIFDDGFSHDVLIEKCNYPFTGTTSTGGELEEFHFVSFIYAIKFKGSKFELKQNTFDVKNVQTFFINDKYFQSHFLWLEMESKTIPAISENPPTDLQQPKSSLVFEGNFFSVEFDKTRIDIDRYRTYLYFVHVELASGLDVDVSYESNKVNYKLSNLATAEEVLNTLKKIPFPRFEIGCLYLVGNNSRFDFNAGTNNKMTPNTLSVDFNSVSGFRVKTFDLRPWQCKPILFNPALLAKIPSSIHIHNFDMTWNGKDGNILIINFLSFNELQMESVYIEWEKRKWRDFGPAFYFDDIVLSSNKVNVKCKECGLPNFNMTDLFFHFVFQGVATAWSGVDLILRGLDPTSTRVPFMPPLDYRIRNLTLDSNEITAVLQDYYLQPEDRNKKRTPDTLLPRSGNSEGYLISFQPLTTFVELGIQISNNNFLCDCIGELAICQGGRGGNVPTTSVATILKVPDDHTKEKKQVSPRFYSSKLEFVQNTLNFKTGSWYTRSNLFEVEVSELVFLDRVDISRNNVTVNMFACNADIAFAFFRSKHGIYGGTRVFIFNDNHVTKSKLVSVQFSLVTGAMLYTSTVPLSVGLYVDRIEMKRNILQFDQASSAGPFLIAAIYASTKIKINSSSSSSSSLVNGIFLCDNILSATVKPTGSTLTFGIVKIVVHPSTAVPRLNLVRVFGIIFDLSSSSSSDFSSEQELDKFLAKVNNNNNNNNNEEEVVEKQNDFLVKNNSIELFGNLAPMFVEVGFPIPPILAPSSTIVAVISLRNELQADSVILWKNKAAISQVVVEGNEINAEPTIFVGILLMDLTSKLEVRKDFIISDSQVSIDVAPSTALASKFSCHQMQAAVAAIFPLPDLIQHVNEISISVGGRFEIVRSTLSRTNKNGFGNMNILSFCRTGPVSDPPSAISASAAESQERGGGEGKVLEKFSFQEILNMFTKIKGGSVSKLCSRDNQNYFDILKMKFLLPNLNLRIGFFNESSSSSSFSPRADSHLSVLQFPSQVLSDKSHLTLSEITTSLSSSSSSSSSSLLLLPPLSSSTPPSKDSSLFSSVVDARSATVDMRCVDVSQTTAFLTLCEKNTKTCHFQSCERSESFTRSKALTESKSELPRCDPQTFITSSSSSSSSASFSSTPTKTSVKKTEISGRLISTGASSPVIILNLVANLDEYSMTLFGSNVISQSAGDVSVSVTKDGGDSSSQVPGLAYSVNRSGASSLRFQFSVDAYDVYATQLRVQVCISTYVLRCTMMSSSSSSSSSTTTSTSNTTTTTTTDNNNNMKKKKKKEKLCLQEPIIVARRFSGVPAGVTAATRGLADTAAVVAPTFLSRASIGTAVALNRQALIMSTLDCSGVEASEQPLDFLSSPTQLSFGKKQGMYFRGAAVGNLLLLVVITILFGFIPVMYRAQEYNKKVLKRQQELREQFRYSRQHQQQQRNNNNNNNSNSNNNRVSAAAAKQKLEEELQEHEELSSLDPKFQAQTAFPGNIFLCVVILLQGSIASSFGLLFLPEKETSDIFIFLVGIAYPVFILGFCSYYIFPSRRLRLSATAKVLPAPKFNTIELEGFRAHVSAIFDFISYEFVSWKSRSKRDQEKEKEKEQKKTPQQKKKQEEEEEENKKKKEKQQSERSLALEKIQKEQQRYEKRQETIPLLRFAVERIGDSFACCLPEQYYYVFLNDVFITVILGFMQASAVAATSSGSSCQVIQLVAAFVIAIAAVLAALQPLFSHLENGFNITVSFANLLSLLLILSSSLASSSSSSSSDSDSGGDTAAMEAALVIDFIVSILSIIKFVFDLAIFGGEVLDSKSRRHSGFRRFLKSYCPSFFKSARQRRRQAEFQNRLLQDQQLMMMGEGEELTLRELEDRENGNNNNNNNNSSSSHQNKKNKRKKNSQQQREYEGEERDGEYEQEEGESAERQTPPPPHLQVPVVVDPRAKSWNENVRLSSSLMAPLSSSSTSSSSSSSSSSFVPSATAASSSSSFHHNNHNSNQQRPSSPSYSPSPHSSSGSRRGSSSSSSSSPQIVKDEKTGKLRAVPAGYERYAML